MNTINVEYEVSKEEFVNYYFWDKYIRKHSSTLLLGIAITIFFGIGVSALANGNVGMITYSVLSMIIFSLFPRFYKKRLGKVYDGDKFYGDKISVKISDKGIEVKKNGIKAAYQFNEMYKVIESSLYIYIGYSKVKSSYIIKSKYTNEQLDSLREIFKSNIDADKLKLMN